MIVAQHGGEALAALEKGQFDVVLMDLQMPEMDGFEALRGDSQPRGRAAAGTCRSSR